MVIVALWALFGHFSDDLGSMGLYSIHMVDLPFSVLNRKLFDQLYHHRFSFLQYLVLSMQQILQGPGNIGTWISYQCSNFAFGKANSEIGLFQSEVGDGIWEVSLLYCNKNGHHCLKLDCVLVDLGASRDPNKAVLLFQDLSGYSSYHRTICSCGVCQEGVVSDSYLDEKIKHSPPRSNLRALSEPNSATGEA